MFLVLKNVFYKKQNRVVMPFLYRKFSNRSLILNKRNTKSIVFIDSSIYNCDVLAQQVVYSARVIVIGSRDDGVKEISKRLETGNCSEIHIFSTGTPGCIYLGNSELSLNTLITYSSMIKKWFNSCDSVVSGIRKQPHLYLYGSNSAAGDAGEEFITKLSQITHAKVGASVDISQSDLISKA